MEAKTRSIVDAIIGEGNPLIGEAGISSSGEEDILASLSHFASAPKASTPKPGPKIGARPNRTSQFWSRSEDNATDQLKIAKAATAPKKLVHVDVEIEKSVKANKELIPSAIHANIGRVRDFLINEIAPMSFAIQPGTEQAQEVVKRVLNEEVDMSSVSTFSALVRRAINLKLAKFVATEFGIEDPETLLPPKEPGDPLKPLRDDIAKRQASMREDFSRSQASALDTLKKLLAKELSKMKNPQS